MESCIDGTKIIGVECPYAVIRSVLIGLSAILYANLLIKLAVAGATNIKSACAYFTCSISPVSSKTTFCPVANSILFGCMILQASSLMKHFTFAP